MSSVSVSHRSQKCRLSPLCPRLCEVLKRHVFEFFRYVLLLYTWKQLIDLIHVSFKGFLPNSGHKFSGHLSHCINPNVQHCYPESYHIATISCVIAEQGKWWLRYLFCGKLCVNNAAKYNSFRNDSCLCEICQNKRSVCFCCSQSPALLTAVSSMQ